MNLLLTRLTLRGGRSLIKTTIKLRMIHLQNINNSIELKFPNIKRKKDYPPLIE